jgi:hypothetical protein
MTQNGDRPQSVKELAFSINVDPELLSESRIEASDERLYMLISIPGRLMRHLGATGYLIETQSDEYIPTSFIKAMSLDEIGGGYPVS